MKALLLILLTLLLSIPSNSQDTLTRGEVYDFDIGDVFHYRSYVPSIPPNADRVEIIDKFYSETGDTVNYVREFNNYIAIFGEIPVEYSTEEFVDTMSYGNLDVPIAFWLPFDTSLFITEHYMYFDSTRCGVETNGYFTVTAPFEPTVVDKRYAKGLGLTYDRLELGFNMPTTSVDRVLIYYNKVNGIQCGNPDSTLLTGIRNNIHIDALNIFPNPAKSFITLKLPQSFQALRHLLFFDLTGRQVKQLNDVNRNQQIDISAFSPGIYLVEGTTENGIFTGKVIVE
jgi:hypothetical protein